MRQVSELKTRSGVIRWPAFVPVTTLTGKFPLDEVVRPFIGRMAKCALVSMHYAKDAKSKMVDVPLMLDSGGFGLLRDGSRIEEVGGLGSIVTKEEDGTECTLSPNSVIQRQEELADIGFTLDFPVPPGTSREETERRMRLTLANAEWAVKNRRRKDLVLFGGLVGESVEDYVRMARQMAATGVEGLAVGGMVPRAGDWSLVERIVTGVLAEVGNKPVHVFGMGKPSRIKALFEMGVTSCDSSSYVRSAAEGQVWGVGKVESPEMTTKLHAALANLACATGHIPLGMATSSRWLDVAFKGVAQSGA
jgi:helicase